MGSHNQQMVNEKSVVVVLVVMVFSSCGGGWKRKKRRGRESELAETLLTRQVFSVATRTQQLSDEQGMTHTLPGVTEMRTKQPFDQTGDQSNILLPFRIHKDIVKQRRVQCDRNKQTKAASSSLPASP